MPALEAEYKKILNDAREELHTIINAEKEKGMAIKELIKKGDPTEAILNAVREEGIDLLILLAIEEKYMEHFLFGRINEEIIRKMPRSVLTVKKEPETVKEGQRNQPNR